MLGLHRDPEHFNMSPIDVEVRRRCWWHLVHIDVLVAIASGLPPMVDLRSLEVQGISELKEELFGTQVGMQYALAVKTGERPHDAADDPRDPANASMISTSGILVAGKLRSTRMSYSATFWCPMFTYKWNAVVLRRTLARLFTRGPLTTSELVAMRLEFKLLGEDLASRIGTDRPLFTVPTRADSQKPGYQSLTRST